VLGFVISTRAALAAGVGLVVADRLSSEQRRRVGFTLIAIGAVSTIPALRWVLRSARRSQVRGVESDAQLIGARRYDRKGDEPY
jgi:hypothetical protein